jgi:hypothetical protein
MDTTREALWEAIGSVRDSNAISALIDFEVAAGVAEVERRTREPEFVERIAEAVHIGWMQEKQRQGFADHPFSPVAFERDGSCTRCGVHGMNHHADMRPYADLAESTKEYDRATVRAVLDALASAGSAQREPVDESRPSAASIDGAP